MLFYFCMLVAVWFGVMALLASGGAALFKLEITPESKNILPLAAAFIVGIAAFSNYEFIKSLDETARQLCVRLASIPLLAEQLGHELSRRASFRVVNEDLRLKISEVVLDNIGPDALNFANDGSLSSRFTRAIALYWLFVDPHNNKTPPLFPIGSSGRSGYTKIMNLGESVVSQVNDHYQTLMEVGAAYFTTAKPLRQVEETLRRATQQTADGVCGLIARFVLLQEKTFTQRRNRLTSLGFDHYDEMPMFDVTRWALSMLVISMITLAAVALTPRSSPIGTGEAVVRVVVFAIQIGISLAAATVVAQRFVRRSASRRSVLLVVELTVACLIVLTISSIVRIGGFLVSTTLAQSDGGSFDHILSDFVDRAPALLYPVINTISITLLCSYLLELKWRRSVLAITGAVCNGLAFVGIALVVSALLPNTLLRGVNVTMETARLIIVLNSGLIGLSVGAMVIAMFKRTIPLVQVDASSKVVDSDRMQTAPSWNTLPKQGEWADKALGGYSRGNEEEELEGSCVCFRPMFAKPELINAYLLSIRWDKDQSCLIFEEERRADSAFVHRGKIYLPPGKPFMNLVTVEKGDVRLITVCRPDAGGVARGLIMTLSVPGGVTFIPASVPIVLRRLGKEEPPRLGFIHPGEPDYKSYQAQLLEVVPHYGVLGSAPETGCAG
jgi:hypothetical protein